MGFTMAPGTIRGLDWDAGCGDDRKNPAGVFRAGQVDQGDLLRVSRKVVRKVLRSDATEFHYEREEQPFPRIGPWKESLDRLLTENAEGEPRAPDADPAI